MVRPKIAVIAKSLCFVPGLHDFG
jgi:hypothetical protein